MSGKKEFYAGAPGSAEIVRKREDKRRRERERKGRKREGERGVRNDDHVGEDILISFARSRWTIGRTVIAVIDLG